MSWRAPLSQPISDGAALCPGKYTVKSKFIYLIIWQLTHTHTHTHLLQNCAPEFLGFRWHRPGCLFLIVNFIWTLVGLDSSVGTATGYGLDGPRIESRFGRDFPHLSRLTLGPPNLLYNGYQVFPGGKERPGRDADSSPLLVPWSRKSTAIHLLPLWAVRPVQSLSALYLTLRYTIHYTQPYSSNILVLCSSPLHVSTVYTSIGS